MNVDQPRVKVVCGDCYSSSVNTEAGQSGYNRAISLNRLVRCVKPRDEDMTASWAGSPPLICPVALPRLRIPAQRVSTSLCVEITQNSGIAHSPHVLLVPIAKTS